MKRIVALVPDMIDRSRVAAAASAAGRELVVVREASDLVGRVGEDTDLVLLDLARPGVLEVLADLEGTRTIGFASHVDRDLIRRARAAGCGKVLARSAFFSGLGALLSDDEPDAVGT
ncbi:MAG: response regulator receiver protein [Acidimicrobiaceae bacterium]|nr:response regulator receiver protein [Acidimicrobiaceae bacterium]